jgi:hypothetical protein
MTVSATSDVNKAGGAANGGKNLLGGSNLTNGLSTGTTAGRPAGTGAPSSQATSSPAMRQTAQYRGRTA